MTSDATVTLGVLASLGLAWGIKKVLIFDRQPDQSSQQLALLALCLTSSFSSHSAMAVSILGLGALEDRIRVKETDISDLKEKEERALAHLRNVYQGPQQRKYP